MTIRNALFLASSCSLLGAPGCGSDGSAPTDAAVVVDAAVPDLATVAPDLAVATDLASGGGDLSGGPGATMSFFISSERGSANLGGLMGADARCQRLAAAVGQGKRTWRAYLSEEKGGINARDRIGAGPWFNAKGVRVADNLADLHGAATKFDKTTALDEQGRVVNGRGDTPNEHDILTGSTADGLLDRGATCADWTSEAASGVVATLGHHDRQGGGAAPMSWNSAHRSTGCSLAALVATGGAGHIYCFAAD